MWSFGCILAELYTGEPIFPGENEMDQLGLIMELKGVPEEYLLDLASRRKLFFDADNNPIIVENSKGRKRRPNTKSLKTKLNCTDAEFLDFLDKCLDWNPVDRLTPLEAL
jgi:dual specificity tyrosine-phosphorylation-regulated kinase 2/3/4